MDLLKLAWLAARLPFCWMYDSAREYAERPVAHCRARYAMYERKGAGIPWHLKLFNSADSLWQRRQLDRHFTIPTRNVNPPDKPCDCEDK